MPNSNAFELGISAVSHSEEGMQAETAAAVCAIQATPLELPFLREGQRNNETNARMGSFIIIKTFNPDLFSMHQKKSSSNHMP